MGRWYPCLTVLLARVVSGANEPSYATVLRQAWPAILASAAVPLLGLVDTAIIAVVGGDTDLGAVALSTLILNSIYWALGFSRMSTTALVAQAVGAGQVRELWRVVARALALALVLGAFLVVLSRPLTMTFLEALNPTTAVSAAARTYVDVRIFGAPAVLAQMAVSGALIGLGRTRALLGVQLFMNAVNVLGNVAFVWGIGGQFRGVVGIAAGSVCAEWAGACLGAWLLFRNPDVLPKAVLVGARTWFWNWSAWGSVLSVNRDIFLRTLALLGGFAWFTRTGTQLGEQTLAGNHLLQQVVSFSAFFLDGVAFVAESHVGRAIGAKDRALFHRVVTRTSVVAAGFAVGLGLVVWATGRWLLTALAPSPGVLDVAQAHLPFAAWYVVIGVIPWQLDGIFIGAARGAALRNAAVVSSAVFGVTAVWWTNSAGNAGLWSAMLVYIAMRGFTLLLHWRHVTRLFV